MVEKLAHTYAEAIIENEIASTCANEGSYDEVVYCSACGEELSRVAKATARLPHTVVIDVAVAPTCTAEGLTDGKHCSVCGTVIKPQKTIIPVGHTDNNGDNVCDVCGEEIPGETVVQITFFERIIRQFANIFDKIFNIFKKFFSK